MKFTTVADYDYTTQKNECKKSIHQTVPDQAYSIKQILDKFVRGQPITNMVTWNGADYNKGETIDWKTELQNNKTPDPYKMDLTERKQYQQEAKNKINELKEKHKKQNEKQNTDTTTHSNENSENK